jgi:hypothetical protein
MLTIQTYMNAIEPFNSIELERRTNVLPTPVEMVCKSSECKSKLVQDRLWRLSIKSRKDMLCLILITGKHNFYWKGLRLGVEVKK